MLYEVITHTPDLSDLHMRLIDEEEEPLPRGYQELQDSMKTGLSWLIGTRRHIHETAITKAEKFILKRIEADGTLYSYASSTILIRITSYNVCYTKLLRDSLASCPCNGH